MKLWEAFSIQKREDVVYYNTQSEFETEQFARHPNCLICQEIEAKGKDGVMFLCISTDWSAGDSLGPLVGHKPRGRCLKGAAAIGILDKPAHTMNLDLCVRYIRLHYPDYVIVAIDISVGSSDHVGYATLGRRVLQPGLGVSKELEATGDIAITGIMRGAESRGPAMLQSMRLSIVMKMADCICEGICFVERLWESAAIV